MVIPSQARKLREGVETGRQAPSGECLGEGTVQPTNPKGAVKTVVGCITGWSQVRILPGPYSPKLLLRNLSSDVSILIKQRFITILSVWFIHEAQ
jgi:hypothetical protein